MKNVYRTGAQHRSLLREILRAISRLSPAVLLLGALLPSRAQEFLVKNINTVQETVGSAPTFFVPVGNNVFYFKANDGIHGTELWRSDGTAEGTALVADITASSANADPASLINVNGTLFFTATESAHGRELWKSDGTAAGTVLVADINPGTLSSNPTNLVAVGNLVFFSANSSGFGIELWKSDGTAVGTVMVRDINGGGASSNPSGLIAYKNLLVFAASNGNTNGNELWISDGTSAGTTIVKDINPGTPASNPQNFVVVSNQFFTNILLFTATGSLTNTELWRTDGTAAGTVTVREINPGGAASNPQNLVNVGGKVFFSATSGFATGVELWKSDGTSNGTVFVRDIVAGTGSSNPQNLVNVGGTLFFTANSPPSTGVELWKSDGTTNGTVLVRDINPGIASSNPTNLVIVNGTLYFAASNLVTGVELWRSDGTTNGTVVVKDIRPGPLSSAPQSLANINGTLIFSADDGIIGRELWKSDGTSNGTVVISNIRDTDASSSPVSLVNLNGTLIFAANDGVNGFELWKSDGTEDGTVFLKDINAGANSSNPTNLVLVNGTVFFAADDGVHGRELWKTDGTEAGTTMVKDINPSGSSNPSSLVNFNGTLFFAANDGSNGTELWTSDGTAAGTVLFKDIFPGFNSNPTNLVVMGNTLFFSADNGSLGAELWKSDGTVAGTVLVKDINPGIVPSNPNNLVAFNNTLYFTANSSTNTVGIELWKSDGTDAGTVLVKDINSGGASSNPQSLVVVGNLLYFSATGGGSAGNELWASDGTTAGTFQVKDINPGTLASSNPQNLVNFNGALYFSANDGVSGRELWKSDGTDAGTVMVVDINAGAGSSNPTNLFVFNGTLYFSATDGVNGSELWQSDGTAAGTFMVGDITDDSNDANPGPFTVVGNTMYFAAQTPAIGRELFGFILNHTPTVANPIVDQESVFGAAFNFTIPPDTFADEDAGQTLTYAAYDLPPGINFTPGTATFSGNFGAAGEFTVTVTATDNGPVPLSATNTFVVTVQRADPGLTWATPADIVYGTALGASQLNATANTTGTSIYTPAAGTILHAGAGQTLSVSFTPSDTNDYNVASATVSINVLKASLTATAADKSRTYGAANPPLTINYSGFVNGDTASVLDTPPVASTSATQASPVGSYPITLSGGSDNDYDIVLVNGTLTVTPASLTVMANNAAKTYGQPNPTFTGTIFGIQNSDNITATYSSPATDTSLAGTYPIIPTLVDPDSKLGNYSVTVINGTLTVTPAALSVTITAPPSGFVQSVNSNILFTGVFTPSGASSSYLAWWTFSSDGMTDIVIPGVVSNQTVSAQVAFTAAGVYSFSLTVTNEFGPSAVATNVNNDLPAYVVIYDPDGGFVTGGGWINSPAGAYTLDSSLVGKATFGFVSKYQHGASIPTGQTQFNFHVADLNFHSTSYDWLVISGAKAQYQGSGTINGDGDYAFKLTATDGQVNGGGGVDKFRMKIWEKQHNILIYDNQLGASDNSDPTTAIQAGSIVIHKE